MAQLISNLPIGAKVKFGKHQVGSETPWDITWIIVAKNHTGYPSNSVTLFAEKCLDALQFDASELNSTNSSWWYGNNRYSISNIDQWLNSPDTNWYVSRHTVDSPPDYTNRKGFLYHFTDRERSVILSSTIRCGLSTAYTGEYEDITRKIFLSSISETEDSDGNGVREGSQWAIYGRNPDMKCGMFEPARINSTFSGKPISSSGFIDWWTRSSFTIGSSADGRCYNTNGYMTQTHVNTVAGIRPVTNISSSVMASDTTDNDGCYTLVWNSAPNKPSTISVPTIYGGKANTISWSKTTDPDGDTLTYQLECSLSGGSYTQLYKGTALSYAHLVPFGTTNVTYRVRAVDPSSEGSAYTISSTITVINNYAPVILNANGEAKDVNLGVKSDGFTGTYKITDANNNSVTVTESIDGVQVRSLVATLGATITYGITGDTWLTLPNGSHTLTIRATDGMDSSVRNITFTKLVNSFTIENSTPLQSTNMPTRIMMVVTRVIPSSATFKVEVCNNGYDSTPTWEDATAAVLSGLVHVFTNTTKTASNWGVKYRITVNRNGAAGACYVSSIGGNFE
jgi:3D (Asp-Asp-Asp) domain-containing protein